MMRKAGFLLLAFLSVCCVCASASSPLPKQYTKQREDDSIQRAKQYEVFISFVKDSLQYYVRDTAKYQTRDTEIQSNFDSIYAERLTPLENSVFEVKEKFGGVILWVRILSISLIVLFVLYFLYIILNSRNWKDVDKWKKDIVWKKDVKENNDEGKLVNESSIDEMISARLPILLNEYFSNNKSQLSSKTNDKVSEGLANYNHDLERRIEELEGKIEKLEKANHDNNNSVSVIEAPRPLSTRPIESKKLLFADSIIDRVFSHVREQENDDTVFILELNHENEATIKLFERAYNKVLANASYLEGCETQIVGHNSIEIEKEGKAEKTINGEWKVTTPMKIKMK